MFRFLPLAVIFLMASCVSLPKSFQTKDEVIAVGPGPEDMIVDTITEETRILISCNQRRDGKTDYGEIEAYYPATGAKRILKRINEPEGLIFNPHGIDLVKLNAKWPSPTTDLVLLVVNHEHTKHINSILRYHVLKDELVFINKIVDSLIYSPNAVTGFTDGTILVSNDLKKQRSVSELIFKVRKAQVVYWDGKKCSLASDEKFCYTNGITIKDNKKVYLASTMQNKVWQFDFDNGRLINKQVVGKVYGADNIRFDGNDLLVPGHLRFLKFIKHVKDSAHYSPTTVYRINPATKKTTVEYYDSGEQLSAGSTALIYGNYIYVSGIFDGKMVRKRLTK
ncbi:MAG TPA: hypothetical protein VK174_09570 [Chitinophagales bacterium]|nr:hypothetical protein [Chitinophagales bacterium]